MKKVLASLSLISMAALLESCSTDGKKKGTPMAGDSAAQDDAANAADDGEGEASEKTKTKKNGGSLDDSEESGSAEASKEPDMVSCSMKPQGRSYKGFGGGELAAGREDKIPLLGNRYRVKPFEALSADITRVFGTAPPSLAASASSFPKAEARWFVEPIASGVSIFTVYRVAYQGGQALASSDQSLAAAPTPESAQAACTKYIELAWQRPGTPDEINHCKNVAIMATAAETDVKNRWAYTIASILTAADFLSY